MSEPRRTRRILILGGSPFQVPLIEYAKAQGDYLITADYLPDNPGHQISDEYHNVSTTDSKAISALAQRLKVDAVMTFASDPALPAVARAAAALGLPGTAVSTVDILTRKDRFRRLLEELNLPCPRNVRIDRNAANQSKFPTELLNLQLPIIIKPTDASGSKGVRKLDSFQDICEAINIALGESLCGECIVEEYVTGNQVHGDVFFRHGKLVFSYFGDHQFVTAHGVQVPYTTKWPSNVSDHCLAELHRQLEVLAQGSGYMCGPMNVEARIAPDGRVFLIDISPRNGGNNVPIILEALTGFNFRKAAYDLAVTGESDMAASCGPWLAGANFTVHAPNAGTLVQLEFSDLLIQKLLRFDAFKKVGDPVECFSAFNKAIGSLALKFRDVQDRNDFFESIDSHLILTCVSATSVDGEMVASCS